MLLKIVFIKCAWNEHYEYRQDGRYSGVGNLPIWEFANAYDADRCVRDFKRDCNARAGNDKLDSRPAFAGAGLRGNDKQEEHHFTS